MIQALGGIVWQRPPTVRRNDFIKEGAAWYASGVERVEVEGTAGWRHAERHLYLQADGTWDRSAYYFATEAEAQKTLDDAVKDVNAPSGKEITAFELALRAAQEKKKRRK